MLNRLALYTYNSPISHLSLYVSLGNYLIEIVSIIGILKYRFYLKRDANAFFDFKGTILIDNYSFCTNNSIFTVRACIFSSTIDHIQHFS